MSEFLLRHPGGVDVLSVAIDEAPRVTAAGIPDVSAAFDLARHTPRAVALADAYCIGVLRHEDGCPGHTVPATKPPAPPPPAAGGPGSVYTPPAWFQALPGPPPHPDAPETGNLLEAAAQLLSSHTFAAALEAKHGGACVYRVGRQLILLLADPHLVDALLCTNPPKLGVLGSDSTAPQRCPASKPASFPDGVKALFGDGVLTIHHDRWHARRSLLRPAFSLERLASLLPVVHRAGDAMMEALHRHALAPHEWPGAPAPPLPQGVRAPTPGTGIHPDGALFALPSAVQNSVEAAARRPAGVDVLPVFKRATFDVIVRGVFGDAADHDELVTFRHMLEDAIVRLYSREYRSPAFHDDVRRCTATANAMASKVVRRTRVEAADATPSPPSSSPLPPLPPPPTFDVTQRLVAAMVPCGPPLPGDKVSAADLSGELLTLLLAGHETSANTLAWTVYELSRHPALQAEVAAEVDTVVRTRAGGDPAALSDDALRCLPLLDLCIRETLRLHATVPNLARCLREPFDVLGVQVPAGVDVVASLYAMHRSARLWGPSAGVWHPRRVWNHAAFRPFGVSPRDCLGRHLAFLELRCLLARLLSEYSVRVPDGGVTPPAEITTLTLSPVSGVPVHLVPRPRRPAAAKL